MSKFKVGDRVDMTLRNIRVTGAFPDGDEGLTLDLSGTPFANSGVRTIPHSLIETGKVEFAPPKAFSEPGTYVRNKKWGYEYLILVDGYVDLTNNRHYADGGNFPSTSYEVIDTPTNR